MSQILKTSSLKSHAITAGLAGLGGLYGGAELRNRAIKNEKPEVWETTNPEFLTYLKGANQTGMYRNEQERENVSKLLNKTASLKDIGKFVKKHTGYDDFKKGNDILTKERNLDNVHDINRNVLFTEPRESKNVIRSVDDLVDELNSGGLKNIISRAQETQKEKGQRLYNSGIGKLGLTGAGAAGVGTGAYLLGKDKEKTAGFKDRILKDLKRPLTKAHSEKFSKIHGKIKKDMDTVAKKAIDMDNPFIGLELVDKYAKRGKRVVDAGLRDTQRSKNTANTLAAGTLGLAGAGAYALSDDKKEKTAGFKIPGWSKLKQGLNLASTHSGKNVPKSGARIFHDIKGSNSIDDAMKKAFETKGAQGRRLMSEGGKEIAPYAIGGTIAAGAGMHAITPESTKQAQRDFLMGRHTKTKTAGILESNYTNGQEEALAAIGIDKTAMLGSLLLKGGQAAGKLFGKAKTLAQPAVQQGKRLALKTVGKDNYRAAQKGISTAGQTAKRYGKAIGEDFHENPELYAAGAFLAGGGLGRGTKDNTNQYRQY